MSWPTGAGVAMSGEVSSDLPARNALSCDQALRLAAESCTREIIVRRQKAG
jgi:hypothetical protein